MQTACAQNADTARTVLYGTVRNEFGSTIVNTYVLLKGSPWGTITDSTGNYRIDITGYLKTAANPEVEFQYLGYKYVQYIPDKNARGEVRFDLQFFEHEEDFPPYFDPRKKHKKKGKKKEHVH